ncbi:MAG: type II secretion system protein [Candidatus Pacebacteria bacterium]|nr:type II secretion system protein [Candidatus Paceibacterota bacterium]
MITSRPQVNKQAGFTLVEMLVAVAIFVIVAMVVTSVFITLANANRKAQSIRLVMDNLNFAIDSVALKMREGSSYKCNTEGNDNEDCNQVNFYTVSNEQITYYLDGGRIYSCYGGFGCTGTPITAPEVTINEFIVFIHRPEGGGRARAALLIKGVASKGKTETTFNIQTTVSERVPANS